MQTIRKERFKFAFSAEKCFVFCILIGTLDYFAAAVIKE
jgi:hypothetical protein